ncbi:phenylacetate--CoA ligase family protein [Erysipelotrichaceae bacterium AF15-26LB]|nr:putative adenylate-forming enzyme [Erysipelotrichaceae bacterium 3_1_53]MCR0348532.1 AMP-binding protein [[Clostridium] innocuum]RJV88424.1 phenylacetate--CoA ligase family protein [Erysipelotrichaceae bacterium AF19-24AC]RJV90260.1 phenylacetate--CoA ligase family protein [Erysipelotrichaceae bacterium AF15-26LB]
MKNVKLLWELYLLKKNTKKTTAQIQKLQQQKLYRMLQYAYDHSPYYKASFLQAGISRQMIGITPLSEFPTINKAAFMEHFDELVTTDDVSQSELRQFDEQEKTQEIFKGKYHVVHSSGSTGKPGYFIYDEAAWNRMLLGILRGALWDMSMPDILRLLWNTPRIVYIAATDGRYGGAMAVSSGIEGVHALQLSLDIKQPLQQWVDQIQKFDPNIIIGYSSAIKILAELAQAGKVELHVKRVISCGEPMHANLRAYLEKVLHCDVVNFYGASESLAIGVESCAEEGMYLFDDMNYIEIAQGKMYITSLYNFTQPLIRYELSDHLVRDERKGRYPFSRIKNLTGRNEDLMWFADEQGNREFLHPLAVEGFCMEGMLDYQFIQNSQTSFELHIEVLDKAFQNTIQSEMSTALRMLLNEKKLNYVQFIIRFVKEILPDRRTGKKLLIVRQEEMQV